MPSIEVDWDDLNRKAVVGLNTAGSKISDFVVGMVMNNPATQTILINTNLLASVISNTPEARERAGDEAARLRQERKGFFESIPYTFDVSDNIAALTTYQRTSWDAVYQLFHGSATDFELALDDAIDEHALVVELGAEVAGLHSAVVRIGGRPQSFVWHATSNSRTTQSVLDGIDTKFLSPEARFGRGFCTVESAETALAEMSHHGVSPKFGIRFEVDSSVARVLDLTDDAPARAYGYTGGEITDATRGVGKRARADGYNAIRYWSMRSPGANLVVIAEHEHVFIPYMVGPVNETP